MTSNGTALRRGGLRAVLVGAMVALATLLAALGVSAPAQAHSGGKAVVLVRNLTLTPATGDSWTATLKLADLDSGNFIPAADAKITLGKLAPVPLLDAAQNGVYTAKISKVTPGPTDIRLVVRTAPGGIPVAVYDKSYPATVLVAGEEKVVTAEAAGGGGGGGSNTGMIVGIAGAVLLIALLYGLFSVRRRSAVPARAK